MSTSSEWVRTSVGALWLSRAVVLIAGVGLIIAALLGVTAFVRDRPINAIALLFPAVAAVALGQIWGILVLSARRPQDVRRGWLSRSVRSTTEKDPRRFFFDGLPK